MKSGSHLFILPCYSISAFLFIAILEQVKWKETSFVEYQVCWGEVLLFSHDERCICALLIVEFRVSLCQNTSTYAAAKIKSGYLHVRKTDLGIKCMTCWIHWNCTLIIALFCILRLNDVKFRWKYTVTYHISWSFFSCQYLASIGISWY